MAWSSRGRLRQSCRRLRTTVDEAFAEVIAECAEQRDGGQWINGDITAGYRRLHELGWAHSIETWDGDDLVGGLYGVCIGGLFAGESMFHRVRGRLKGRAGPAGRQTSAEGGVPRLLDVQWVTQHLASLGAVEIPRDEYQRRLAMALVEPAPAAWKSTPIRHGEIRPRPRLCEPPDLR